MQYFKNKNFKEEITGNDLHKICTLIMAGFHKCARCSTLFSTEQCKPKNQFKTISLSQRSIFVCSLGHDIIQVKSTINGCCIFKMLQKRNKHFSKKGRKRKRLLGNTSPGSS